MKTVYVVLAYDQYYPKGDNIRGVYLTEDDAETAVKEYYAGTYDYAEVVEKRVWQ